MNFASCHSPPLGMEVGHLWKWWQNPTSNKSSNGLTLNTIQFGTNKTPNIVHSHSPPETCTHSFFFNATEVCLKFQNKHPFKIQCIHKENMYKFNFPNFFFNPQPYPHLLHWNQWISQIHGAQMERLKADLLPLLSRRTAAIFFQDLLA